MLAIAPSNEDQVELLHGTLENIISGKVWRTLVSNPKIFLVFWLRLLKQYCLKAMYFGYQLVQMCVVWGSLSIRLGCDTMLTGNYSQSLLPPFFRAAKKKRKTALNVGGGGGLQQTPLKCQ
jgi:hypothetical protein